MDEYTSNASTVPIAIGIGITTRKNQIYREKTVPFPSFQYSKQSGTPYYPITVRN